MIKTKLLTALLSLLAVAGLALGTAGQVYAQEDTSNGVGERVKTTACTAVENRIKGQIERFDNNKGFHQQQFENLRNRVSKIVDRLKAKGFDTSDLTTDLATLDTKIAKFKTDYTTFIDKLRESQDLPCGESQGAFKDKIQESRDALKIVRADVKDIVDYYRNTIKPDLQKLRDQKPETTTETETETQ